MIYDLPNEEIAFYQDLVKPYYIENQIVKVALNDTVANDSIAVTDSILEVKKPDYPSYELFSFVQEDSIQKIFKKELVEEGLMRFVFRYPATSVDIRVTEELPDTFNIIPVYSTRKDTILWYFTPCKDSLWISINNGINISDTTHYSLKPRKAVTKRKRVQEEEKVKRLGIKNNLKSNKLKPEQPLIFTFNEPIVKINQPDSMHFAKLDE